jgi:magnesium transporter
VLKLYRWPYDDWRSIGEELPPEIIWIDLISPSAEEKQFVESRLKIRVPSEESLSEIEASSRLVFEHGTLYLSSPTVRIDEDNEAQLTSIGFVIGPRVLVTVRFWPLPTFDTVAKQMQTNGDLQNGMCVFTSIPEAMG